MKQLLADRNIASRLVYTFFLTIKCQYNISLSKRVHSLILPSVMHIANNLYNNEERRVNTGASTDHNLL